METHFKSWFTGKDLGYVLSEDMFAIAVQGFR